MPRRRAAPPARAGEPLTALARLIGEVDERVRLQQARVELATALQRHLLPPALPSLPGLRLAARYTPARDGLEVGGDWYDTFVMPDGSAAIAIGDVQGHDVEAVAFMGQVRTGLRAIASLSTDPGEILGRANDLFVSMGSALYATCCFLRFDTVGGHLALSRAGHVPLVWSSSDGRCGVVLEQGGLPLGIRAGERYPVTRRRLTQAGTIVLLTDGVVEGPSFPIEQGLERVSRVVHARPDATPDALAAEVIKVADLTGHSDDAAVLVVRYDGVPEPASTPLSEPRSLGMARPLRPADPL